MNASDRQGGRGRHPWHMAPQCIARRDPGSASWQPSHGSADPSRARLHLNRALVPCSGEGIDQTRPRRRPLFRQAVELDPSRIQAWRGIGLGALAAATAFATLPDLVRSSRTAFVAPMACAPSHAPGAWAGRTSNSGDTFAAAETNLLAARSSPDKPTALIADYAEVLQQLGKRERQNGSSGPPRRSRTRMKAMPRRGSRVP